MTPTRPEEVIVSISIDTEEDDWGSYVESGASTDNIMHLEAMQDVFERRGAQPTYLVNRAPLMDARAVEVLGKLGSRDGVEIGAHCHPWNTPPFGGEAPPRTMMCTYSVPENHAKLREVCGRLRSELGVTPRAFRAGRWGFGPSVAAPLAEEGFDIDCSVSPFIDWTADSGPDYTEAPHRPYRFEPDAPLRPHPRGSMAELPTTVGFLTGDTARQASTRKRLEQSVFRRTGIIGLLDRAGLFARRWLSPETSSGATMIRLADACVASGQSFLQLTFHSCALLPGATPFVRDNNDRAAFFRSVDEFLAYCGESGFRFRTLSEARRALLPVDDSAAGVQDPSARS